MDISEIPPTLIKWGDYLGKSPQDTTDLVLERLDIWT